MTSLRFLRFKTDFEKTPEGDVVTLPGYGGDSVIPSPGEDVQLFDEDGNTCRARVTAIEDTTNLIHLEPYWDTWHEASGPVDDLMEMLRHVRVSTPQPLDEKERKTRAQGVGQGATIKL